MRAQSNLFYNRCFQAHFAFKITEKFITFSYNAYLVPGPPAMFTVLILRVSLVVF